MQDPVDNDNPFGPEKPGREGWPVAPEPEPINFDMTGDASDSFGLANVPSMKVPKGGVPQAKIHNVAKKSQKLPIVDNSLGRREPFERLKDIEDANVGPTIGMGARRQRSARRSSPSRRQRQRNRRRWMDDRWNKQQRRREGRRKVNKEKMENSAAPRERPFDQRSGLIRAKELESKSRNARQEDGRGDRSLTQLRQDRTKEISEMNSEFIDKLGSPKHKKELKRIDDKYKGLRSERVKKMKGPDSMMSNQERRERKKDRLAALDRMGKPKGDEPHSLADIDKEVLKGRKKAKTAADKAKKDARRPNESAVDHFRRTVSGPLSEESQMDLDKTRSDLAGEKQKRINDADDAQLRGVDYNIKTSKERWPDAAELVEEAEKRGPFEKWERPAQGEGLDRPGRAGPSTPARHGLRPLPSLNLSERAKQGELEGRGLLTEEELLLRKLEKLKADALKTKADALKKSRDAGETDIDRFPPTSEWEIEKDKAKELFPFEPSKREPLRDPKWTPNRWRRNPDFGNRLGGQALQEGMPPLPPPLEQQRMQDSERKQQLDMEKMQKQQGIDALRRDAGFQLQQRGDLPPAQRQGDASAAGGQLVVTGDDEAAQKMEKAIEKSAEMAANVITNSIVGAFKTGIGDSQIKGEFSMKPWQIAVSANGLTASIDPDLDKKIKVAVNEIVNPSDNSMRDGSLTSAGSVSLANNSSTSTVVG